MQKFLPTLLIGFLVFVPLLSGAADDPLVVRTPGIALQIPSVAFDLRPVVNVLTAPFRFLAFVKEKIDAVPKQIAGFFTAPSRIEKLEKEVEAKLGAYRREADANPIEVGLRYIQPEPSRTIIREKEIIREIIVKDNGATTIVKESAIPPAPSDEKLSALKTELTDSFASRINKLTGGFGFNTNRFDDLFVQKSLELAGKLNQPPAVASSPITFSSSITSKDISATSLALSSTLTVSGTATSTIRGPLVAGSGNVQIIDSSGRIPALSSTYFASLPGIFASIGNASSTVQFSASSTSDVLSFEGTGGITISFDSINKKIVFSSTNPTLLSVLQQGADASSFTGTTKIAGLTITSSGTITAGTWQGGAVAGSYGGTGLSSFSAGDILYASATTTLSRLGIGSTNTILTSSGSLPQWSSSLALGGTLSAGASVSSTATILTANQTGSGLIVDFQQSGSSRFSVNTAGNLTVAGTLNVTGDITTSGKLRESSGALIPTGAVLPFNLSTCPAGWSALDGTGGRPDARGRYITGLPASGTLAGTNGTALSNLEDRPVGQHNHGITDPTHRHDTNVYTDGGATPPSVPLATSSQNRNGVIFTGYVGTGITINNAGSVAGTNAPYIQFLLCQKD